MREAAAEFGIGPAQGLLGIDFDEAREVDQDEQQVAEFVFEFGRADAGRARFVELGELFVELVEHLLGVLPIEADAGGAGGDLLRFHQRGQGARNAVRAGRSGLSALLLLSRRP